jgi:hypothetical protein
MSRRWNGAPKKSRPDAYPHLRKVPRRPRGSGPPSRRARVIHKALLRADRRWDTYAAKVRKYSLPWEKSKKTKEWRLIVQNSRLIRRLRKMPKMVERSVRLARLRDSQTEVPTVQLYQRAARGRSDSFVGE